MLPGGLDDADFNANPGTFSSGKEFQSSYSIVLNGDFLFDLLLKRK
jgi:hypothetical protein